MTESLQTMEPHPGDPWNIWKKRASHDTETQTCLRATQMRWLVSAKLAHPGDQEYSSSWRQRQQHPRKLRFHRELPGRQRFQIPRPSTWDDSQKSPAWKTVCKDVSVFKCPNFSWMHVDLDHKTHKEQRNTARMEETQLLKPPPRSRTTAA